MIFFDEFAVSDCIDVRFKSDVRELNKLFYTYLSIVMVRMPVFFSVSLLYVCLACLSVRL